MKFRMKRYVLLSAFSGLLVLCTGASAQQIFRCAGTAGGPPEYINNAKDAQVRNCKPMAGGNVTVVQGVTVQKPAAAGGTAPVRVASTGPVGGSAEQRARDSDSRAILEAELRKAESQLAEQQKEYNNGEPEKQGIEGRNYQRYLDRVAEMKDGITRTQSDIAGLRRELSRLPAAAPATAAN